MVEIERKKRFSERTEWRAETPGWALGTTSREVSIYSSRETSYTSWALGRDGRIYIGRGWSNVDKDRRAFKASRVRKKFLNRACEILPLVERFSR